MALAHHDAALHYQRSRRETKLVGAKQRTDHDVAARFHLAVGLYSDASS
jgi:hypothetical protein